MKAQREKTCKLPTARENAGDHVVIGASFAFDWLRERGTSFLDQSQSEVKQNQCNPVLLNWKLLYHSDTMNMKFLINPTTCIKTVLQIK